MAQTREEAAIRINGVITAPRDIEEPKRCSEIQPYG